MKNSKLVQKVAEVLKEVLGQTDVNYLQMSESFIIAFRTNEKYSCNKHMEFLISDGENSFFANIDTTENGDVLLSLKYKSE